MSFSSSYNDVLYFIMSHVKNFDDRKALNITCKTFHNIALILAKDNIWTSEIIVSDKNEPSSVLYFKESTTMAIYCNPYYIPLKPKKELHGFENIKTLTLSSLVNPIDLSKATQLMALKLDWCDSNINKMILPSTLTTITMYLKGDIVWSLKYLTSLKTLHVSTLEDIRLDLPSSLKHLSLEACNIHVLTFKGLSLDVLDLRRYVSVTSRSQTIVPFYVGTLIRKDKTLILNSRISTKDL
jgi:hypothetical protein